jgi:hypothetical protein
MRLHRSLGTAMMIAGLLAAPAAIAMPSARLAQTEPVPGQPRQRAPGVPLAPNPAEAGRAGGETPRADGSLRGGRAEQAQRNATPEPGRDPPMPRGVPSIIQN